MFEFLVKEFKGTYNFWDQEKIYVDGRTHPNILMKLVNIHNVLRIISVGLNE